MYESGNEKDIVESINEEEQKKQVEDLKQQIETLKKMVENRNAEMQKPNQEEKFNKLTEVIIDKIGIHKILERQDEQQKMLDAVIHELGNTNQSMNTLVGQINQMFSGAMPQAQAPNVEIPQMGNTSPELKLQALSSVLPAISEIVKTIKGTAQAPNGASWFEDFSKQIIANMLQAGVDGMMRNVYENYNPIPPKPISSQLKQNNHQLE